MTTPAKIEPWMRVAATEIDYYYWKGIGIEEFAATIAAHAPQEPPEWEAKEKALRELADRWMDEMESMTTPMRHQSLICSEHASDLLVILNREQEKP